MKIVAISGSLRAASVNTALLRAAAGLAPEGVEVTLCEDVATLPHFNPDIEIPPPPAVARWQQLLLSSDAVLIACPEYAHGVPGAFKNALDWAVGTAGLEDMPVGLLNASPRAVHAQAALAEIITTMHWQIVPDASATIPLAGKGASLGAVGLEREHRVALQRALAGLAQAAGARRDALTARTAQST